MLSHHTFQEYFFMGSIFFTYGETIISPISSQGIHYKVNLLRIICTKKDNSSKKEYGHK